MIYDHFSRAYLYRGLGPRFELALDFLRTFDARTPAGKLKLAGDDVYAMVQSYGTSPASERKWESHRCYVDVQFMVTGEELIYHAPLDQLEVAQPYDAIADYELYQGPDHQYVHMRAGDFGIFFPHDGHKPGCSSSAPGSVNKVVVKVRLGA